MAKMKATEEVSGGTLKRRSPVDRHYAKRPVQLNSTSLKLNGVGTTGDVAPGTPCQDRDGFGVRRFDGACGQSRARTCDRNANCVIHILSLGHGLPP